jgi:hypothetical protein
MSPDERSRTRTLDPARQARDQVRAGLPVTVCPFCGGPPGGDPDNAAGESRRCCCVPCWDLRGGSSRVLPAVRCLECPHRPSGEPADEPCPNCLSAEASRPSYDPADCVVCRGAGRVARSGEP